MYLFGEGNRMRGRKVAIDYTGWVGHYIFFGTVPQSSFFGFFLVGIIEHYPIMHHYQLIISHPLHIYGI